MANVLGNYDPVFYASEALILLYKALGMANRVYRGYDKTPTQLGSVINLRKPMMFTAQDAPGVAADLKTESFAITLSQWKEVRFTLTDKELSYTGQQIIADHITPAVFAIADKIDQDLCALADTIPWTVGAAGTAPFQTTVLGFTDARRVLFNNRAPLSDLHFMLDGVAESNALALQAFSQWQGAGAAGVDTQLRGTLGNKFGFEVFANQNVHTHVTGTASVTTLAVNGAALKGATAINVDAVAVTGTLVAGDILSIAGDTQKYTVSSTFTAAANAFTAVAIYPSLSKDTADNAVVTLQQDARVENLAFHRNAFALAMAPLPDFYDGQGVRVYTAQDPFTQLAIRARTWADGDNSKYSVALDVLYGYRTLDANLGVVLMG